MATSEGRAVPRPISVGNGEFRIDGKAAPSTAAPCTTGGSTATSGTAS